MANERTDHVPVLDGLRGLAILVIVLYHVGLGQTWLPNGHFTRSLYLSSYKAIDILFFTTGFVLFLPVARNGTLGSLRSFALRRWARLAPPYYVCLFLVALLFPLVSDPALRAHTNLGVGAFAAHLTFVQWIVMPANTGFIAVGPVWTLTIDATFYLVLPLIAVLYRRRPFVGLALITTLSILWRLAFQLHGNWVYNLPFFAGDFAAGMTAAWLYTRLSDPGAPRFQPRTFGILAALSALALLTLAYLAGANLPFLSAYTEPAWIAAAFPLVFGVFVVALALSPLALQWPLRNRVSLWFSDISYSVYLYHYPVIFFAWYTLHIPRNHNFPTTLAAFVLPTTLVLATISTVLIDRPFRRWARGVTRRFHPAPVAQAPAVRVTS